ncbi:MAG: arylsulfotransferase family protein, partial [Pirellulales bacterium]
GYTLYTCSADEQSGTQALLIDMRHRLVHRWSMDFSKIRPERHESSRTGRSACFFGTYLYPNGDLLVVFHGRSSQDVGLAKLDAQSNLVWFRPETIHHDVDVAEDGTIYALQKEICRVPPAGVERVRLPCALDLLLALSPDGKLLRTPISILEAFRDSPYAELLAAIEEPDQSHQPPAGSTAQCATPLVFRDASGINDALHLNCVRSLSSELAAKFPAFKAGQVLISLRNPSVIAMLDPLRGRVVWAARGPWLAQHDPQFLDNGHLLIFDNLGSPRGSRVLEFDPRTQAIPWSYSGSAAGSFYTSERGMSQRLPNGNTFIVDSEGGEMIEVTSDGEGVWSYSLDRFIASGRRYAPEQLPFLAPGTRPRP